ncbi:tail fiber domain-containing protein [Hymenobacter sp. BT175]|uniref:tail fiber domain-containing protein n=1 Tax=Hymenobacter translucens TaxID=2886507 RepID=UPI001D0DD36E|nr:tail fiber domain-containing protein [Hymenobacter translucens]MCC2546563.1 tail fiber domain-containing protein [Hymenobacter translucens]
MKHFVPAFSLGAAFLGLLPATAFAQTPDTLMAGRIPGTPTPVTRLYLAKNGTFYLGGDYDSGATNGTPASGAGTRLFWYPGKASFRAGYVNGTQWDDANIGLYSVAMGNSARALGDHSFAVGKDVAASNTGSIAMGESCSALGANSVALGYHANTRGNGNGSPRQGSFVFADRSVVDNNSTSDYSDEFYVETNHAAMWRVTGGFRMVTGGTTSSTNGYLPTRGVSILPGTTSASNLTTDWGQPTALIATSSGAYLHNSGVWTNVSDRNKKHRFEPVLGEDVLARLRLVPLTRWSYKTDPATVRHMGPVAQDFHKAFGLGSDSISIGTVDADGVALAGVQALDARTQKQAAELTSLKAENEALKARLTALEQKQSPSTAGLPLAAALLLAAGGLGLLLRRRA